MLMNIHIQMLSQLAVVAIELRGGDVASETGKFVEMWNEWFDTLNVCT